MSNTMEIIHIREPFYSAGKQYGWEGNTVGIGIARHFFSESERVFVRVGDNKKVWTIASADAQRFVNKYNSVYHAKEGVEIWVVAWTEFSEVPNEQC